MTDFSRWCLASASQAVIVQKNVPDPPGFVSRAELGDIEPLTASQHSVRVLDAPTRARKEAALRQKAFDPVKQAGFMCFMLWMSGNKLQVFSIMMLVTCITAPVTAIANVTKMFPADKQLDMITPRLIFIGVQLGQLAFAAYKLDKLGLLPTFASDWMSQMTAPHVLETSVGPV